MALEESLRVVDATRQKRTETLFASKKEKQWYLVEMRDQICRSTSLLVREERKTTLQRMERAIRKQEVVESDRRMEMDLVRLLRKDGMGTFVNILRDLVGEQWGRWMMTFRWS